MLHTDATHRNPKKLIRFTAEIAQRRKWKTEQKSAHYVSYCAKLKQRRSSFVHSFEEFTNCNLQFSRSFALPFANFESASCPAFENNFIFDNLWRFILDFLFNLTAIWTSVDLGKRGDSCEALILQQFLSQKKEGDLLNLTLAHKPIVFSSSLRWWLLQIRPFQWFRL